MPTKEIEAQDSFVTEPVDQTPTELYTVIVETQDGSRREFTVEASSHNDAQIKGQQAVNPGEIVLNFQRVAS